MISFLDEFRDSIRNLNYAPPSGLRLRTLVLLRWMAVVGQTIAVVVVQSVLHLHTPFAALMGVIACSAWFNLFLSAAYPPQRLLKPWESFLHLCFDLGQLACMVGLTGGLDNPFVFFMIAPVTIGASTLGVLPTLCLAVVSLIAVLVLGTVSAPLPWDPAGGFSAPPLYRNGMMVAAISAILFSAGSSLRVAFEEVRLREALRSAEAVLAKEQRLSALGGLAAAAAHELGTPLATIQVTAKEMTRDLRGNEQAVEDAQLILSQAQRCREILQQLSLKPPSDDAVHDRIPLNILMEEIVGPHRHRGVDITVDLKARNSGAGATPTVRRMPEIIHGVQALVENAVGFALTKVELIVRYGIEDIELVVRDDGPGFAETVIGRLGEPYVSERDEEAAKKGGGMGLGFFIAKTLLERSGAQMTVQNRRAPSHGAHIRLIWPREMLEVLN